MNTPIKKPLAERITPGKIREDENDPRFLYILNSDRYNRTHIVVARGHVDLESRTPVDELNANAELISEAFNVTHETGRTPRQLADTVTALRAALEALELSTTQARLASRIGREAATKRVAFLQNQLEQIGKQARTTLNKTTK